ncbi:hypothetical protein [Natrinema versiforme]|uniref:Uncharacterized protein n=1 Tax=Natrinema versiforme TaxID=88724 RepID=A0A4P8WI05_9EURY|nr:hypothetical protein [Natrinema versiforme]QCS43020.1 hypothetical protein FEJ81_11870 [Natrinema versiforme]
MVNDLAVGILTVLGGAISGFIGISYSEYQSRRKQRKELKEWYNTTILLAKRVERIHSEDFNGSGDYIGDALSGVIGRLTEHLMDSPSDVDTEILNRCEELAAECENARAFLRADRIRNTRASSEQGPPTRNAVEKARDVRVMAEDAKTDVGWL